MLLFRRIHIFLLSLVLIFLLASCGAKKKTRSSTLPNTTHPSSPGQAKTGRTDATTYYADILGVERKKLNPDLYNFIDAWIGSPHRLGGMTKGGVDCSGFASLLYQQVYRKDLPRTSRDMAAIVKRKYDYQLQEGDLVLFSFGGKDIDHVGIYLHNDRFVHVSTKQGVVISNLKDAWYYKYLTRCGTPKM